MFYLVFFNAQSIIRLFKNDTNYYKIASTQNLNLNNWALYLKNIISIRFL